MYSTSKKIVIVLLIVAMVLLSVALVSCNGKSGSSNKTVSKIKIIDGTFKEAYTLDEEINYNNLKIMVYYSDGTSEKVAIDISNISGLDVNTTGQNKVLTVTYKDVSTTFIYNVYGTSANKSVTSPVRLTLAKEGENVIVSVKRTSMMNIFAIKYTLTYQNAEFAKKVDSLQEGWKIADSKKDNNITVVAYVGDKEGYYKEDGAIATFEFRFLPDDVVIKLTDISVSDGSSDHILPDVEL